MQKSIGLLFLIAAFALGYLGFRNLNEKTVQFKIGEVEMTARSSESKSKAYFYLGSAVVCLAVGTLLIARRARTN